LPSWVRHRPRSSADAVAHGPASKALRAAPIAASTSATSAQAPARSPLLWSARCRRSGRNAARSQSAVDVQRIVVDKTKRVGHTGSSPSSVGQHMVYTCRTGADQS
jgi:hypothetical protein